MSLRRLAWRVLIIAAVVWLCVARYVVGRIGTLFVRGKDERRAAVARLRGRVLRDAMERLGATSRREGLHPAVGFPFPVVINRRRLSLTK
jgi:hypothetical protein